MPSPAPAIEDSRILVTGASSGIGAEFARQLAPRARALVLTGRDPERLSSVVSPEHAARITTIVADLSNSGGVADLVSEVGEAPDILINNAGITLGGPFARQSAEEWETVVETNVLAPLRLIHAFLPAWSARGSGAVLDVTSVAAFIACPGQTVYAASKSFLHSFSEGVAGEWRGSGIRMTILAPGSTRTPLFRRGGIDESKLLKSYLSPERVARDGIRALERGKPLTIPGWSNRALDLAVRWLPRRISRRMSRRIFAPLLVEEVGESGNAPR